MKRGDHVELSDGLRWPGIVVAIFTNTSGEKRVVVEHTNNGIAGKVIGYFKRTVGTPKPKLIIPATK
jgi:hypothetical protein